MYLALKALVGYKEIRESVVPCVLPLRGTVTVDDSESRATNGLNTEQGTTQSSLRPLWNSELFRLLLAYNAGFCRISLRIIMIAQNSNGRERIKRE